MGAVLALTAAWSPRNHSSSRPSRPVRRWHVTEVGEFTLFARIAAGDQRAVSDCVQEFGGLVQGLARRWHAEPADAEDAVQEIFIDLWKSAGRYDAAKASPRGFVAMIARRRLIDRARKRGRAPEMVSFPDDFQPVAETAAASEVLERADAARRVLAELTPMQRRMLEMTLLEGKTHEEVALETDTPLGTVKSHVRRGLLRARALMGVTTTSTAEEVR